MNDVRVLVIDFIFFYCVFFGLNFLIVFIFFMNDVFFLSMYIVLVYEFFIFILVCLKWNVVVFLIMFLLKILCFIKLCLFICFWRFFIGIKGSFIVFKNLVRCCFLFIVLYLIYFMYVLNIFILLDIFILFFFINLSILLRLRLWKFLVWEIFRKFLVIKRVVVLYMVL